jgi:hypothetical protein
MEAGRVSMYKQAKADAGARAAVAAQALPLAPAGRSAVQNVATRPAPCSRQLPAPGPPATASPFA